MNRSRRTASVVLAMLCVACGDLTDPPTGRLAPHEAQELAAATAFATIAGTGALPSARHGAPDQPMWVMAFESEVRCPSGGMVGVATTLDVRTVPGSSARRAAYEMRQIHQGCAVAAESGRLYRTWGAPATTAAVTVDHDAAGPTTWGGSLTGSVEWSVDGRRGRCELDLAVSATRDGIAPAALFVSGTVCGYPVQHAAAVE